MSSPVEEEDTEHATTTQSPPPPEAHTSPDLSALLSPTHTEHKELSFHPRDSVADSEFGDVPLDESHFSTVSLNARNSTHAVKSPPSLPSELDLDSPVGRRQDEDEDEGDEIGMRTATKARFDFAELKRLSGEQKRNSAAMILHRLDAQRETDEKRSSGDGHVKLQEEFSKVQLEGKDEEVSEGIDWEFWGSVMADYQTFASENPDKLAKAIEQGIPDSLRGMIWQLMSASKDPEMEATYLRLIKEPSSHEKAITRDLGRTFPHHAFFTDGQGIGQENLFNVLKAYSLYDPQVGYCQGLPFVVAVLLLNMPDEEAFCLLVRLMYSYDLRGHFLPDMPKLQLRLFQFDRLIEEMLPVLHVHLLRQGIKSSMFCSQWFLTLFSYRFPLEIVFRIFDNCLASGIEAIFGFSMALLQKNEEKLLKLKFDEIIAFLNMHIVETYRDDSVPVPEKSEDGPEPKPVYKVDEFVQDAVGLRITPFMLDSYAHEYNDMMRVKEAHALEVDELRSSNRNLSQQMNALESSLTQLNKEHVDVLNQLVMARLRNEELEGELVRYKLLYAEAMHQTEDAKSSHRMSSSVSASRPSSSFSIRSFSLSRGNTE